MPIPRSFLNEKYLFILAFKSLAVRPSSLVVGRGAERGSNVVGKSSGQDKKKEAAENSHGAHRPESASEFRNGPIVSINRKKEMPMSVTTSSFQCCFCSRYNY